MDELRKALHTEIQDEFTALKDESIGTDEYKTTADSLVKLIDRAIEIEKIVTDYELKNVAREVETDLKLRQMDADKNDRIVKYGLTIGEVAAYIALVVWGTKGTFKFEETGSFTSDAGREFIRKVLTPKFFKK